MAAHRLQHQLLNQSAFIARIDNAIRNLNQRFDTNLVFDVNSVRRAHEASRKELEILIDSTNEEDLFEAFDTFIDILVEKLIDEQAFSHLFTHANQGVETIRGLIRMFDKILVPIMLLDDWLRSIVFNLTELAIPSVFQDDNMSAIENLCRKVEANTEDARHWGHLIGYPPLDRNRK
jgi:hypothetical protein